ncbi:MAG: hypothetical protein JW969_09685 [Spirochaetales bacterium]|nr:hypothetical protein [Spirochaetales bacterium]
MTWKGPVMYDIEALLYELDTELSEKNYSIHHVYALDIIDENTLAMGDERIPLEISPEHIKKIAIVTTDWGPFLCDVYLVIYTADGKAFITEQEAPFYMVLYNTLAKLEGFDYEAVIKAMGTTDNGLFVCYGFQE